MSPFNTLMEVRSKNGIHVRLMERAALEADGLRVENPTAAMGFSYCFVGDMSCVIPGTAFHNRVGGGESGIWGAPAGTLSISFQKGMHRWLDVLIDKNIVESVMHDTEIRIDNSTKNLFIRNDTPFTKGATAGHYSQFIINQIINCPFDGVMKDYYIESKGMEFVVEELSRHLPRCGVTHRCCTNRKRIEDAWRLLVEDLEHPRTITDLAHSVGMSESTLKRSFRKLYGASIFTCFQNHRMLQARSMLRRGELNVTEVAFRVGYASSSHFSRAFHRHFGFPPKLCQEKDGYEAPPRNV